MSRKKIIVFEHQTLVVDGELFLARHFKALVKFNDRNGQKYLKIGYNKVIFTSYVGVIQVDDLIIEVLPKADNHPEDEVVTKWQNALTTILTHAGNIKIDLTDVASQSVKNHNLLDILLYHFLELVEQLIRRGIIKKYRRQEGNNVVLKGRLIVGKQITVNLIHKERFFTEYTTYDHNNIFNRVLKTAISTIVRINGNAYLKQYAAEIGSYFEAVQEIRNPRSLEKPLVYNRRSESYREAVDLGLLIIRNQIPSFNSGEISVIAFLLNMNQLFEKFVFRLLKNEEINFKEYKLEVKGQTKIPFWLEQNIKADIILEFYNPSGIEDNSTRIVIDTKWKRMLEERPDDGDLKQMFTYNYQYGATHSILLYPHIALEGSGKHDYQRSLLFHNFKHGCEVRFAHLFDESGRLDKKWAFNFLNRLINK